MMTIISSALFALSASLDAFLAGAGLGIRKIHISLKQNLIISLVTLAGTILSICLGQSLTFFFPGNLASLTGSVLLILMGAFYLLKFMLQSFQKYHKKNRKSQMPKMPPPSYAPSLPASSSSEGCAGRIRESAHASELLFLSLTLSLNNIGIGISASIAGIRLLSSATLTFLFSVLLLALGNRLGKAKMFQPLQRYAEPVTGLLLILLGLL